MHFFTKKLTFTKYALGIVLFLAFNIISCHCKNNNKTGRSTEEIEPTKPPNPNIQAEKDKEAFKRYQQAAKQGGISAEAQRKLGQMYAEGRGVDKDYQKAAECYQEAAKQGDVEAQTKLGWLYAYGRGLEKNVQKAIELFEQVADRYIPAQTSLGLIYQHGRPGIPADPQKAFEYFKKGADQGNTPAKVHLGRMYANGEGVTRDHEQAIKLFRESADQRNAQGKYCLSWMYRNGYGTDMNIAKAVELRKAAAAAGDKLAQLSLGLAYQAGEDGLEKRPEEARKWFKKAAEQGNARAKVNLGWMYENGLGISKNSEKALELYQEAANQGDVEAKFYLARLYENAYKNREKAIKLYQEAAEAGNAKAQNTMARICRIWRVDKNYGGLVTYQLPTDEEWKEVAGWYRKAAEQGLPIAQVNLGSLYQEGSGVPQSDEEALKWYRQAADQNFSDGAECVAEMYEQGKGVGQSDEEAFKWYLVAAKSIDDVSGDGALYKLAEIYENGRGLSQLYKEVFEVFQKETNNGRPIAMVFVGLMYAKGHGVDPNPQKAKEYLTKAVERGNEKAKMYLEQLHQAGKL